MPVQPTPPVADPTQPVGVEPLAPTETDDPRRASFLFPGDGGGPGPALLGAIDELASGGASIQVKGSSVVAPENAGTAFGLRVPLGASLGELARTAGKAVQEFAFPLTLAIAVLLFLLFQGELDRRDPKLAYAPVDSTKDMVSFE
ncbi:MAG: hypothetical protein ABR613_09430 [Actinomycetota bacterium]